MKEMGESGPAVAVNRVPGSGCRGCQPRRHARFGCQPRRYSGDGSVSATYTVADSHRAPVSDGRTGNEDR